MSELFEKLLASKKYRDVCPDTIRRVWDECSAKYKKEKDADKAAREALHGITSAFMTEKEYHAALELAASGDRLSLLSMHASTRERLPVEATDAVYAQIFAVTGAPVSVLDLACGLNPVYLAARHPDARIVGRDISGQCVRVARACGLHEVETGDLLCENAVPKERFHIALLFKILPLLERQRAGASDALLARIDAEYLVLSFPTRTLGGRNVGMARHYSDWLDSHMPESRAVAARFATDNELYVILKET